ncbi:signal peptidase II [Deinococcus maricopensis]|uniref:Lipoprotein signal peptidase n=1 Tax=Deinococcus maricopensis (strain DSM 21211 / LMG 22137 / NRRL B-23946 / LB-34) TaxID=709986 RepID=E8U572_DEIML|nr:signal peptidase II [Deinococcus maricopensis]ADV66211.1 Lipoprotein signal peptidase [Deinococcus maricopensis DSM 21211]
MQPTLTTAPARAFPRWVPLLIAALLILADQALKAWANAHLTEHAPLVPFIPGVLSWFLTYNTGAAWSLFSGGATILAIGRLLVGLGILVYVLRRPQGRFMDVVLAMIAAGAIGNTIDGLRFGRVTDMLYSPALSAVTRAVRAGEFPVFNIADCCIVVGVLLLIVSSLLPKRAAPGA